MASTPYHRSDGSDQAETSADPRSIRLAELIAGLTGCELPVALDALGAPRRSGSITFDDPLQRVARAMTSVSRSEPDRFRVAGYVRAPIVDLPRRPLRGVSQLDDHLVHHGSLRRWDRLDHHTIRSGPNPAAGRTDLRSEDDGVIDLRDHTDRFRRPDGRRGH